jgi:hypothetical protein
LALYCSHDAIKQMMPCKQKHLLPFPQKASKPLLLLLLLLTSTLLLARCLLAALVILPMPAQTCALPAHVPLCPALHA